MVTVISQCLRLIVQIAGVVTLAHLLSPHDFGLVVMVTAIVGVGEIVRDFGLSSAAVQARELSAQARNNLFWLNLGIGSLLAVACILIAPLLAEMYGQPQLRGITVGLAATFLFNGLATQHLAQLARTLKFGTLAAAETLGPVTGLIAAVIFAALGSGYWALVGQQVVAAVVTASLAILLGGWLPGRYRRDSTMASLLRYGRNVFGVQMLTYASRNADSITLGITAGPRVLGYYDRAFQLLMLPLNQINAPSTKVALPVLSRLQPRKSEYDRFLLFGQSIMVHLVVCLIFLGLCVADPLVAIGLGSKWQQSAFLFQILAIGGIAQTLSYATYWHFMATGRTASNFKYAVITRPILVGAVVAGSHWGAAGVASGYSLTLLVFWPFGIWWISKFGDAPGWSMLMNGMRALIGYGVAAALALVVVSAVDHAWIQLVLGFAAYSIVIGVFIICWPSFRSDVGSLVKFVTLIRERRITADVPREVEDALDPRQ